MSLKTILAAVAALTLAGACAKTVQAPLDRGVCWHAVPMSDGTVRFNRLSEGVANLETCAARLEAMRLQFLGLGGQRREIMGAYQGNFLFLENRGVFTARSLNTNRYLALVRTGDGRLAIPGAMPNP